MLLFRRKSVASVSEMDGYYQQCVRVPMYNALTRFRSVEKELIPALCH